jgi:hypothetical protein
LRCERAVPLVRCIFHPTHRLLEAPRASHSEGLESRKFHMTIGL